MNDEGVLLGDGLKSVQNNLLHIFDNYKRKIKRSIVNPLEILKKASTPIAVKEMPKKASTPITRKSAGNSSPQARTPYAKKDVYGCVNYLPDMTAKECKEQSLIVKRFEAFISTIHDLYP